MQARRAHIDPKEIRQRLARGASADGDPDGSRRVLVERARRLAEPPSPVRHAPIAAVAFDANGERYAIPTSGLARIERAGTVVRLPGAPTFLVGIIPVRNRSWPLLHLPTLLGSPRPPPGAPRWAVLLDVGDARMGFGADEVALVDVVIEALHPVADTARVRLGLTDDARVVLDGPALAAYAARRLRGSAP